MVLKITQKAILYTLLIIIMQMRISAISQKALKLRQRLQQHRVYRILFIELIDSICNFNFIEYFFPLHLKFTKIIIMQ